MNVVTLSTCNLNQWAMDFTNNTRRIIESCKLAKKAHSTYRLGPELEITGYGCEDHFLETDTFTHSWESLATIINSGATDDLLCDFGMPVHHKSISYNCRVLVHNRTILLIRPKCAMADNGNYRESRYFTAYRPPTPNALTTLSLPPHFISSVTPLPHAPPSPPQTTAPFGVGAITSTDGVTIGAETCEELWAPNSPHIEMSLSGVDIITNGSGSHHELRKLNTRLELIISATRKCGGAYVYSNQCGCDGGRLYYDGSSLIVCNGDILAQAKQFDVNDIEVITATIDLDSIRSYRSSQPSFGNQATTLHSQNPFPTISPPSTHPLTLLSPKSFTPPSPPIPPTLHSPQEECAFGPACWLWDYLKRSGAGGFFLPLSGGADSSSVAAIVAIMCHLVTDEAALHPTSNVAADLRRVLSLPPTSPIPTPTEMANKILVTTYMGTQNSGKATEVRAQTLASTINSYHMTVNIDPMITAILTVFKLATGKTPSFTTDGGTITEDLALQNIQARMRMVLAYLFAQLVPWCRGTPSFLLVLGSANVDEGLRGYMTKYDCSSADLNPIGAISKLDLKSLLRWASDKYDLAILREITDAPPSAELRPVTGGDGEHTQTDEEDMGMSYEELSRFGKLRKLSRAGPVSMFKKLIFEWGERLSVEEVATKVKRFFLFYGINRHKMCTITPAYHAEAYSPDDNRFDLRQFLYPKWEHQFEKIDEMIAMLDDGDK